MKKLHLACAGLAALAGASAMAGCNPSAENETAHTEAAHPPAGGLKIAYVEIDSLMTRYDFCKDYTILLNKKGENIRATLAGKERALQNKAAELQKKYETNQFTTKEQALENFQSTSSDIVDALDGSNPLPASIDVELSDPQLVEQVANALVANSDYQKICDTEGNPSEDVRYGEKSVERLFSLTNYVRYIGVALIVLLIFIAMVFINNTIRLAILARRKEIAIMRLVGASNGFIRGPFLMEGALHAIIGSLLAVGSLELLRNFALPQVQGALAFLPFDLSLGAFLYVYIILIVAGLLIGLIGSALAMRRYLKV